MSSVGSYQDISAETVISEKSIFIWLDILGFADAIENEERFLELAKLLNEFQAIFTSIEGCFTKIISDGLLLRIANPEENLNAVFDTIGQKKLDFIMKHKTFIRGGIAIGSKLDDTGDCNHDLISQGLARAAKMEGSFIDWPIIATNQENLKLIQEFYKAEETESFGLSPSYNRKGEKIYFIDFLKEPLEEYHNLLNDKIYEFETTPSVQSKYIWLLRQYYHRFPETVRDARLSTEVVL